MTEHHSKIKCITCHKTKNEFKGLNKNCESCHKDSDGYFKHGITGLMLDETHSEFYCKNCHENNNYKKKPICSECHEDDDISFPKNIPGTRVK